MRQRTIPNRTAEIDHTSSNIVTATIDNKREKSRLLANRRAKILIKRLRMMGNLGGAHHDLNADQIEKLIKVLETEFAEMLNSLRKRTRSDEISDIL